MKKWIIGVILALSVGGCRRYEPVPELPLENGAELENTTPDLENQAAGTDDKSAEGETAAGTKEETASYRKGNNLSPPGNQRNPVLLGAYPC